MIGHARTSQCLARDRGGRRFAWAVTPDPPGAPIIPITDGLFAPTLAPLWAKHLDGRYLREMVLGLMREDASLSFEAAVALAGDEWSFNQARLDRAMLALRLYLHELLGTRSQQYTEPRFCTTWYVTLAVQAVHTWGARQGCHVLFLSLNYDTLLEQALGLTNHKTSTTSGRTLTDGTGPWSSHMALWTGSWTSMTWDACPHRSNGRPRLRTQQVLCIGTD